MQQSDLSPRACADVLVAELKALREPRAGEAALPDSIEAETASALGAGRLTVAELKEPLRLGGEMSVVHRMGSGKSAAFVTLNYDETLQAILTRGAELKRKHGTLAATTAHDLGHLYINHANGELDRTNLSRLIKVARDWTEAAEAADVPVEPEHLVTVIYLHGVAVLDGQHRARAWFRSWSLNALPTLFVGATPRKLLERLRLLTRSRSARLVPLPRRQLARPLALVQLAHSIVPHAPPALAGHCP